MVPETSFPRTAALMLLQAHFSLRYNVAEGISLERLHDLQALEPLLSDSELERCCQRRSSEESSIPSQLQLHVFEMAQGLVGHEVELEGRREGTSDSVGGAGARGSLRISGVESEVLLEDTSGTHTNLRGIHTADVLVKFEGSDRCMVLEVDGPSHFLRQLDGRGGPLLSTGGTLLRNTIIKRAGCELRLPATSFGAVLF